MSPYNPWEDPTEEIELDEVTERIDLSERLVYIIDNDKMYTKLVYNAQLRDDGTVEMDDGTLKQWIPYKHI